MIEKTLEEKLISVCNQFDLPITLADPDQKDCPLIYVSRKFLNLTGYEEEDVVGKNCRFLQGEQTNPTTVRMMSQACHLTVKHRCCIVNYRQDGSAFNNLVTIEPIMLTKTRTLLMGCQYEFDHTVTAKQLRFQIEYINVLLRTLYRHTTTSQKLLADAGVLRKENIILRSESAYYLALNHLSQIRALNAIGRSKGLLEKSNASKNTRHKSA